MKLRSILSKAVFTLSVISSVATLSPSWAMESLKEDDYASRAQPEIVRIFGSEDIGIALKEGSNYTNICFYHEFGNQESDQAFMVSAHKLISANTSSLQSLGFTRGMLGALDIDVLRGCDSLKSLYTDGNNWSTPEAISSFNDFLRNTKTLERLDVCYNCFFSPKTFSMFMDAIRSNQSLQIIDLHNITSTLGIGITESKAGWEKYAQEHPAVKENSRFQEIMKVLELRPTLQVKL